MTGGEQVGFWMMIQRTPAAIAVTDSAGVAKEDTVKTPTPVTPSIANKTRFAVQGLPNLLPMNRSDTGETITSTTILTLTTPTRATLVAHTFELFGSTTPTTSAFHSPAVALGNNYDAEDTEEDEDDEDEDEFFDAIDSNNIPNLVIPEHLGMVGGPDQASIATTSTSTLALSSA